MAWTSFCETFGRVYSEGIGPRTATRVWLGISDIAWGDSSAVLTSLDSAGVLPLVGESYPDVTLPYLTVISRSPSPVVDSKGHEQSKMWKIELNYSEPDWLYRCDWTATWTTEKQEIALEKNQYPLVDSTGNPATRIVTDDLLSTSVDPYFENVYLSKKATSAAYNLPVTNSAGVKYNPSIQAYERWGALTLVRYYTHLHGSVVNPSVLISAVGQCNGIPIKICGVWGQKWQWMVEDILIEGEQDNTGSTSYRVTYKLLRARHTHLKVVPNFGFQALNLATGNLYDIPNGSGQSTTVPVPINADGSAMEAADYLTAAYYEAWAPGGAFDFNVFQFPTEMPNCFMGGSSTDSSGAP